MKTAAEGLRHGVFGQSDGGCGQTHPYHVHSATLITRVCAQALSSDANVGCVLIEREDRCTSRGLTGVCGFKGYRSPKAIGMR